MCESLEEIFVDRVGLAVEQSFAGLVGEKAGALLGGGLTGTGATAPNRRFANGMLAFYVDPDVIDTGDIFDGEITRYIEFIRATKPPSRDLQLAATALAQRGSALFDQVGCSSCHVRSLTTAAAGTWIVGGTYTVPQALGSITFHPYSDFLLHDVGTGDGIIQVGDENYGRVLPMMQSYLANQRLDITQIQFPRRDHEIVLHLQPGPIFRTRPEIAAAGKGWARPKP